MRLLVEQIPAMLFRKRRAWFSKAGSKRLIAKCSRHFPILRRAQQRARYWARFDSNKNARTKAFACLKRRSDWSHALSVPTSYWQESTSMRERRNAQLSYLNACCDWIGGTLLHDWHWCV